MSRISILWVSKKIKILEQGQALCDRLNYSLLTAQEEVTGLKLARQHYPQIIIYELNSFPINGYNFLQEIRQDQNTSIIPVIFLSKTFDSVQHRQVMAMGADDILFAPYSEQDLVSTIRARLTRQEIISERSRKELEQLRHNITVFLPHEIRTPLTGIIAGTDLLLNSSMPLDSSIMRELLHCINSSAKRLSRLAHNFLLYCELKALANDPGKIRDLRNQKTDSAHNNIAQTSLKQTNYYHRQEDLTLDLQETSVKINASYLIKLVEELIDNACKFSKQGTPIKICSQIQKDYLVLSISDRGRGMTSQQIEQIGLGRQFERSIYEQQGFGLGLAIAKNLTQLHGGKLQISSIPQETTTVTLTLPLSQASATTNLGMVSSSY